MNDAPGLEQRARVATDGEIAAINLQSARQASWRRFLADPRRDGLAEAILEQEMLVGQFLGDPDALDRMTQVARELARVDDASARTALVAAQVAGAAHRFAEARQHLAQARLRDAPSDQLERQSLACDQACGTDIPAVLDARRRIAALSGRLEDLVPLGSLLADLERFDEADAVYRQALESYDDVSPFPLAWTCFQLGMLWGELVADSDPVRAEHWYRQAIAYLPSYVRARVHLAEICAGDGRLAEAEGLLRPSLPSGEPEVAWRLADVLVLRAERDEAAVHLAAARARYEELLARHELAFADHAAEFYAGSGNDTARALALAEANAVNRPTRRALEQVSEIRQGNAGGSGC